MNFQRSFQTIKRWLYNLVKTLLRRYHLAFALAGFTALAMAAISWTLETSESYWFWHRYYKLTLHPFSLFLSFFPTSCYSLLKCLQHLAYYNIHIFFLLPLFKSKYWGQWDSTSYRWKLWTGSSGFTSKKWLEQRQWNRLV